MPKRKTPETAEAMAKARKERFVETARQLEADETGEAFERAFAKALPPKTPPSR